MQRERIKKLLLLYQTGTISDHDLTELAQLISADEGMQTIPVLRELMEQEGHAPAYDAKRFDALFDQILNVDKPAGMVIGEPIRMNAGGNNSQVRRIPWLRYAAAILLLAGVGGYLFFQLQRRPELIADDTRRGQALADSAIAPGGDKAVLTLANGETIILDNAENGALAKQGNMNIQKLSDGQLAYLNAGAAAGPGGYNAITTPRGGQYSITLPDGTRVWLNSASSLRYPVSFTGGIREVELSGEAYFEVASHKKMPFRVKRGPVTIDVLATAFNIMGYSNEESVNTTLVEGAVRVSGNESAVLLKPGQQANVANDRHRINVVQAEMKEALAWKNGEFRFKRSPIEYIMRQVERWYDVEVEYDEKMPEVQLSGMVLRKENVSELLKIFEATKSVAFKIDGKKIIVSRYKK